MSLNLTLTDAQINAARLVTANQQMTVQGSDFLPIVVDLSSTITLGRAILVAIAGDDELWKQFGERPEAEILKAITSIAFVAPTSVNMGVLAYATATVHIRPIPATEITYLPFSRLYRDYVQNGTSTVLLDVGVAL